MPTVSQGQRKKPCSDAGPFFNVSPAMGAIYLVSEVKRRPQNRRKLVRPSEREAWLRRIALGPVQIPEPLRTLSTFPPSHALPQEEFPPVGNSRVRFLPRRSRLNYCCISTNTMGFAPDLALPNSMAGCEPFQYANLCAHLLRAPGRGL